MKRLLIIVACLVCLTGCDSRDDMDIKIEEFTHFINTTQTWEINTYNDIKCVDVQYEDYGDGRYTVTLSFQKIKDSLAIGGTYVIGSSEVSSSE